MGILSSAETIRNARKQSGMSQTRLAEGICSTIALSNFETGKHGVSPSTFSLIMSKLGKPCEEYPLFKNMNDFECSKHLEDAKSYINYCRAELAMKELELLEQKRFNNNKYYYQRWVALYSYILILDETPIPDKVIALLRNTVLLTQPKSEPTELDPEKCTGVEKKLLLFMALFYLIKKDNALICSKILKKLNGFCSDEPDTQLLYVLIECIYSFLSTEYKNSLVLSKTLQVLSLENSSYTFLVVSVFFMGMSYSKLNDPVASKYLRAAFQTARSYYPFLADYFCRRYKPDPLSKEPICSGDHATKITFRQLSLDVPKDLTDGSFDIYGKGVVTLGSIIETLRKRQKISQQSLCYGLCSKPTLSKIEKNLQNPNILVAQALLERLGLSSKEFIFYGTKKEAEFYRLKEILINNHKLSREQYTAYLKRFEKLSDENPLIRQQYYLFKTQTLQDKKDISELCERALRITLPGFNMRDITKYRLSWTEMTLVTVWINSIAFSEDPYDAPYYFQQLYQYSNGADFELLWKKNHLSAILSKYIRYLGENKMYPTLLARMKQWDFSCCDFNLFRKLNMHYYCSQAYLSINETKKARQNHDMAVALATVLDNQPALKKLQSQLSAIQAND